MDKPNNLKARKTVQYSILDLHHRPCNIRATTRSNAKAKSHPEALGATTRGVRKEKAPLEAMLFQVAPRPGLELGTYGLTEIQARQIAI